MALSRFATRFSVNKNNAGSLSILYIHSKYCTNVEKEKKINLATIKCGTGGRSSFNGIVATVFGASGFVARSLCNQLGKEGTQLILPYRCDFYDMMRLKVVGDLGQVLFHNFDLRDQKSIETAVKYSNVVINLIGRDYETKRFKYNDVHVEGVRNIAKACKKAGVDRLIHLSYLNSSPNPRPLAMKKVSGFKTSKWQGEQVLMEEFPDATILKASDIYGTEDHFVRQLASFWRRQGYFMALWENGEKTEKQPVFVSDVAKGLVNIAKDPDTRGKIYQAVGPRRYKMGDIVDWMYKLMRRDENWGYKRYDMKYDPFFQMRVTFNEMVSPAYPLGFLSWEGIEREATSDEVLQGVPTLEDLGVTLTYMENQIPWEVKPYRAYGYFFETPGDFETPTAPPFITT